MFSSDYPPALSLRSYVRSEVSQVVAIYRLLHPGKRIRLMLREGDDPIAGAAIVASPGTVIEPHDLDGRYLGCIEEEPDPSLTGPCPETVMVRVTIPRIPTHGEAVQIESDWAPRGLLLRTLFKISPLRYEQLRYIHERLQERRSRRHLWSALSRSMGSPAFLPSPVGDVGETKDHSVKRPAVAPTILVGVHWLEVGGAEALAFDTVQWALSAGLRVVVVAATPALHRLRDRLPEQVTFLRLDRYLPHKDWPRFLERLIRQENIQVIHIHHCTPLYGALSHIRVVAPWVKIVDSTHIIEYADGGYARVSGVWTNYIDVHHAISGQLRQMYVGRFRAPIGRIRQGRMLRRQSPEATSSAQAPFNMRAKSDTFAVSFVGRLYYQKRPILAVVMMKALADWARRRNVKLSVNMVGEGPFGAACDRLIGRYGLQDVVRRFPANTDVPALLGKSDMLLLPSSNEGLALVCYEAIERGAIPVSSAVGAQGEIVPDDLMLPREPAKAVRRLVEIVDRLWTDQDFLDRQVEALCHAYMALAAEPTAEDVLMPIYRAAADVTKVDGTPQKRAKRSIG